MGTTITPATTAAGAGLLTTVNLETAQRCLGPLNRVVPKFGTVFFANLESEPPKKSIECALEYMSRMGHKLIVSHQSPLNTYGSYATVDEFVSVAGDAAKMNFFGEVLPDVLPRFFYIDADGYAGSLQTTADGDAVCIHRLMIDTLVTAVCDFADKTLGVTVPRTAQVADSTGTAAYGNWKGVNKMSFHLKFDFVFVNHRQCRAWSAMLFKHLSESSPDHLMYVDDEGRLSSVMDKVPYSKNQVWRCVYSRKQKDKARQLVPCFGSSTDLKDHLVGIYGPLPDDAVEVHLDMLDLPKSAPAMHHRRQRPIGSERVPDELNKYALKVSAELLQAVLTGLSPLRVKKYLEWMSIVWAVRNVCCVSGISEETAHDLVHEVSALTGDYNKQELDNKWNDAVYRADGYHFQHLRSCLCTDNYELWKQLSKQNPQEMRGESPEVYASQYLADLDRFQCDTQATIDTYNEERARPFDHDLFDIIVAWIHMGGGKTHQVEKLVTSGRYPRILVLSPRMTFTRSIMRRLNELIRTCYGDAATDDMYFRDYRRPWEVVWTDEADEIDEDEEVDDEEDDTEMNANVRLFQEERDVTTTCHKKLGAYQRLGVQMESLHKLDGEGYDLVIVDESESCMKQFSSVTTMKKLKLCAQEFFKACVSSQKLVFMDAFMTDKTLNFVREVASARSHTPKIVVYRDEWVCNKRFAKRIEGKSQGFINAVIRKLEAGDKCVVFAGCRKVGLELVEQAQKVYRDKMMMIYERNTDGKLKNMHFDNVNKFFLMLDLLVYTPTLTCGVSFDMPHFDTLFVYIDINSCCIRDCMQATARVRHFNNKTMYYYVNKKGKPEPHCSLTYAGVYRSIVGHGDLVQRFIAGAYREGQEVPVIHSPGIDPDDSGDELARAHRKYLQQKLDNKVQLPPDYLMDIAVRNKWEDNLTRNQVSLEPVLEAHLRICGYQDGGVIDADDVGTAADATGAQPATIENASQTVSQPFVPLAKLPSLARCKYVDIPVLKPRAAEIARRKRDQGIATALEAQALERKWFDDEVVRSDCVTLEQRAEVFDAWVDDRDNRAIVLNKVAELDYKPELDIDKMVADNPYARLFPTLLVAVGKMLELCHAFGLKNTQDDSWVMADTLEKKQECVRKLVDELTTLLKLRNRSTKDPKNTEERLSQLRMKFGSILWAFGRGKLRTQRVRSRNNQGVSKYNFKIVYTDDFVCKLMVMLAKSQ